MLTRRHWATNLHDAGYRPRRMKLPHKANEVPSRNGFVLKTKASHLDGGHRLWSGMERDELRHVTLPKAHHIEMTTTTHGTGGNRKIAEASPEVA